MQKFYYFILFLFCSTASFSQQVDLEINAGLVGSILKGNKELFGADDISRRYSGTVSLLAGFHLGDFVRIRTGLGYASRGSQLFTSGFMPFYGDETYKIKINYIELPFLLSLGPESINLLVGPQVSFITKSDLDGLRTTEYGLKYGLGVDAGHFLVRFLFYNGLSNMTNYSELEMKNNYFSLAAGWKLIKAETVPSRNKKGKDIIHRVID